MRQFQQLVDRERRLPDLFFNVNRIAAASNSVERSAIISLEDVGTHNPWFAHSPDLLAIISPDGLFLQVNPAFEDALGYSSAELTGWCCLEFLHPEDVERATAALRALAADADPQRCMCRACRKNGSYLALDWHLARNRAAGVVYASARTVQGSLDPCAAGLERSALRYRALFEQAGVAMAEVAPDGRWQLVNDRFCALFGYSSEELLHHSFLEITYPDDRAADLDRIRTADDSRGTIEFEKRFLRKCGEAVWVSVAIAPVCDERGHRTHDVCIFEDLTARKQAEGALLASAQQIRVLIEHAPDAIMVYDVDEQRLIDANRKAEQLFDCSRDDLLSGGPMPYFAFGQPDGPSRASFHEHNQRALAGEEVFVERTICSATAKVKHCEVRLVRLPLEDRRLLRVSCLDITERRRLEVTHRQFDHQFREILRLAPVGAAIVTDDGIIEYANEAYAALHEYSVDELIGHSLACLRPAEQREELMAGYFTRMAAGDSSSHDAEAITKSGARLTLHVSSVTFVGLDGRTRRASFVLDRTAQKRTEQQLVHSASHDPLTGLPNRAYFQERLAQELGRAAREQGTFAVLQVDLNRFKQVNDTLGHHAGDLVLTTQARRMGAVLRVEDTLARLGGDEFAAVLTNADLYGAGTVADKLRAAIREPIPIDQAVVNVDASIGIMVYPHHADEAAELLRGADLAMYVAKAQGGGIVAYSTAVEEQSAHSRELLQDLRLATERGELRLYFQPVRESDEGRVVRAEALLRWQHPTLGLLRPRRFLPAADLSDAINRVNLWVVEEALRQCRGWRDCGKEVGVEVNVAIRSLHDSNFPNQVRALLEQYLLRPHDLTLTVGENTLMQALDQVLPVLTTLAEMGVRIGLDEFGVGQSSLSALSRLPLNQIKVDRSFVAQASTAQGSSLIAMILGITATLGLTAVADAVEQQETWDWLRGLGQLELQGYSGGRPLPAEEFAQWLSAQ